MPYEAGERSQDEVASLEEMEESILYCKAKNRHDFRIEKLEEHAGYDATWQVCNYCGRELYAEYGPNGETLYADYKRLPGSKVVGEKLMMGDFRRELLNRYKRGGMALVRRPEAPTQLRQVQ